MPQAIDMTGKRFGRWIVLERAGTAKNNNEVTWLCRCDCGLEVVRRGAALRSRETLGCRGCAARERNIKRLRERSRTRTRKPLDLTGQTFGRLTVVGPADDDRTANGKWRCKCVCGGESIVRTGDLRRGSTRSCGCLRRERYARMTYGGHIARVELVLSDDIDEFLEHY